MFYAEGKACSALLTAAALGDLDILQLLISSGAEIDVFDGSRETPLYKAASRGHQNVVEFLIANGANINAKSQDGGMPVYIAALNHHYEIAQLLLDRGAVMDSDLAVIMADFDLVKQHLDSGLDPNSKIQKGLWKGESYLLAAINTNNLEIVELFLNYGAIVNKQCESESENVSPLHRAAARGCLDICKLLIAHGAEIDALSKHRWTPLHWAVQRKQLDIVELLIIHGANVNAIDFDRSTPLLVATFVHSLSVVKYLLSHGAEVNVTDNQGWNPLLRALQRAGSDDIVRVLIDYHVDVNVRDRNGCSPLHIAVAQKNRSIVELLLANGARAGLE